MRYRTRIMTPLEDHRCSGSASPAAPLASIHSSPILTLPLLLAKRPRSHGESPLVRTSKVEMESAWKIFDAVLATPRDPPQRALRQGSQRAHYQISFSLCYLGVWLHRSKKGCMWSLHQLKSAFTFSVLRLACGT